MSEKNFLNCMMFEGIILTILGLCVLILPKLTGITFGVMLSSAFIAYGLYKIINSIINRNYGLNPFLSVFLGIFVLTIGILLLLVPKINLLWLIALTGVYFLLESICTSAFISKFKNLYSSYGCKFVSAVIVFLIGLIIIITLPLMSFWVVSMLSGVALLIKGMSKISTAVYNKNNYNM